MKLNLDIDEVRSELSPLGMAPDIQTRRKSKFNRRKLKQKRMQTVDLTNEDFSAEDFAGFLAIDDENEDEELLSEVNPKSDGASVAETSEDTN